MDTQQKKLIEVKIRELPIDEFDGSIESIIGNLESIKRIEESKGFTNIRIEQHDWDGDVSAYYLMGKRLETDKECGRRLRIALSLERQRERMKSRNEINEIKTLRKLVKKHGVPVDMLPQPGPGSDR